LLLLLLLLLLLVVVAGVVAVVVVVLPLLLLLDLGGTAGCGGIFCLYSRSSFFLFVPTIPSLLHATEEDLSKVHEIVRGLVNIPPHLRRKRQNISISHRGATGGAIGQDSTKAGSKHPKPPATHRNDHDQRLRYDKMCTYLTALDFSITSIQANQIIRIFTGSTSRATLEPWAVLPEVVATVLTRLFALVRDRANFWKVVVSQPAEVRALARERIGWLRLFNPSNPEPAYDVDLRVDEQRRFARMLLAIGRHVKIEEEEEEEVVTVTTTDGTKTGATAAARGGGGGGGESASAVVGGSASGDGGSVKLTEEALRVAEKEVAEKKVHRWHVSSADILSMEWVQEEVPSPFAAKAASATAGGTVDGSSDQVLEPEYVNVYKMVARPLGEVAAENSGSPNAQAAVGGGTVPLLPGGLAVVSDSSERTAKNGSVLRIKTKMMVKDKVLKEESSDGESNSSSSSSSSSRSSSSSSSEGEEDEEEEKDAAEKEKPGTSEDDQKGKEGGDAAAEKKEVGETEDKVASAAQRETKMEAAGGDEGDEEKGRQGPAAAAAAVEEEKVDTVATTSIVAAVEDGDDDARASAVATTTGEAGGSDSTEDTAAALQQQPLKVETKFQQLQRQQLEKSARQEVIETVEDVHWYCIGNVNWMGVGRRIILSHTAPQ
jgi:hypothetical protein